MCQNRLNYPLKRSKNVLKDIKMGRLLKKTELIAMLELITKAAAVALTIILIIYLFLESSSHTALQQYY